MPFLIVWRMDTIIVTFALNFAISIISDARVRDWYFGRPWTLIIVYIVYLYAIYSWLPNYMKNRKPYKLKTGIQIYNSFQIIACATLTYMVTTTGVSNYGIGCYPTDYSDNPLSVRMLYIGYSMHILKHIDLLETAFFILRKKHKQVSFLHVYHHITTLLITWTVGKYVAGGMAAFPILANAIVHTIMYTYYFLAATGPAMQAKLTRVKPMITIIQIIQLVAIIAVGTIALRKDCDVPILIAWIYIPNIIVFLGLFVNFYIKNYGRKHKTT